MSEWVETTLGDHLTRVRRKVLLQDGVEYPAVSVTKDGQGLGPKESFVGGVTNYDSLYLVHEDDVVLRTITAFESPVGVAQASHAATYVSGVFLTYEVGPSMLPGYLRLFFQSPRLWDEMRLRATGTVMRRKTISDANFRAIPVPTPSPAEQRRIVDVMAAVDAQIDALGAELKAFRETQEPLISKLLSQGGESWPVMKLGEIGTFTRGRRFTKADYVESGLSAIHYGQIHTDLGLITTEALTYLPLDCRDRMRLAKTGDVVIAATSENVGDLGNATVWLGSDEVAVHDDANIFKHDLDPVFAGCLFFSPEFQQQKVQYAAGTKVTRISSGNLGRIEVPIPVNRSDQERIGNAVQAFSRAADAIDAELTHLRGFRSVLLASLLKNDFEIPESYDSLLEGVS